MRTWTVSFLHPKSPICRPDGYAARQPVTLCRQNRKRWKHEHSGKRGVQDLQVLLQDGFRHEGDKKEEAGYVPLPKFYTFKSRDERERILYKNFVQVGEDVKEMIQEIQKYKVK